VNPAMKVKGYKESVVTKSEKEFINLVDKFDQAWIVSSNMFNDSGYEK